MSAAALAQQATPAAAPQAHFDVHEYRVLGNSVLQSRDIETVLYPLLGDDKTLADVQEARAALEKLYHDRGFGAVFVDIPEQDVTDTIVRLRILEGRLRSVTATGARYFSERKILAAIPAATPGTVPDLHVLQQQVAAVNARSPDQSVVPVLKAGPTPGTVDLALHVDDRLPLHGSLQLDNQYTQNTEPLRATAALSYGNAFAELDAISLQFQFTPQSTSQVDVLAASYAGHPIWGDIRPSVYFINSNSNFASFGTLGVLGQGQIYGTRLDFPLDTGGTTMQAFSLGADYKHFRDMINLDENTSLITPISYLNLSAAYTLSWASGEQLRAVSISADFGPRGAPNGADDFANKRFAGRGNYFYVRASGDLTVPVLGAADLGLRFAGQFAVEPLISNEEFSIAGADGVRGYLEAEELGDSAIKSSLQLQSHTLQWPMKQFGSVFVFFDVGKIRVIDTLPGQTDGAVLRSWGAGINLLPGREVSASLTWADPLTNAVVTRSGDSRILFLVRGSF